MSAFKNSMEDYKIQLKKQKNTSVPPIAQKYSDKRWKTTVFPLLCFCLHMSFHPFSATRIYKLETSDSSDGSFSNLIRAGYHWVSKDTRYMAHDMDDIRKLQ